MAVQFKDYYETLGVKRDAAQPDIQRAYRSLARKFHPDVNKAPEAAERFKQIGEAYEVLKDPDKRERYDRLGADWKNGQDFTPPRGWDDVRRSNAANGGGFNFTPGGQFSDFFEMFFGADGSPVNERPSRPRTKPMQQADLSITLEEAHRGTTRQLQAQGPQGTKRIDVKVPAGVTDGTKMRLKDQGIILKITIAPHPRYTIDGKNITVTLAVMPWQAALGAKVPVQTLGGEVTLTLPAGTSSGARLRLKDKGLKGGDLFIRIQIDVPKTLTDKERELYEQLKNESQNDPHE